MLGYSDLKIGGRMGNGATLVAVTWTSPPSPQDPIARGVCIAIWNDQPGREEYVVWTIEANNERHETFNGDYRHRLSDAVDVYLQRGGW